MRTPVVVLVIAMLALPAAPLAQQREPESPAVGGAAATDTASEPAARKPAARRSLMGMVMATLIESAEQSGRQASTPPPKPAASVAHVPVPADPAAIDGAAADDQATASAQVAVQAVP